MGNTVNLATKYAGAVQERFYQDSVTQDSFAKDLDMADPITLTFADGEYRMTCGKLEEKTPYKRFRTVSECEEVFHITGYKMVDIVVPKSFLQEGSLEDFRALLRRESKRWYDFQIPQKFRTYIRENRPY